MSLSHWVNTTAVHFLVCETPLYKTTKASNTALNRENGRGHVAICPEVTKSDSFMTKTGAVMLCLWTTMNLFVTFPNQSHILSSCLLHSFPCTQLLCPFTPHVKETCSFKRSTGFEAKWCDHWTMSLYFKLNEQVFELADVMSALDRGTTSIQHVASSPLALSIYPLLGMRDDSKWGRREKKEILTL